jgi:hypothetical protein
LGEGFVDNRAASGFKLEQELAPVTSGDASANEAVIAEPLTSTASASCGEADQASPSAPASLNTLLLRERMRTGRPALIEGRHPRLIDQIGVAGLLAHQIPSVISPSSKSNRKITS